MKHIIPTELAWAFGVVLIAAARAYVLDRIEYAPCKTSQLPCWVWKGGGDGRYGHAYFLGMRFKAHRLSYLAFNGRIPRGRVVDHRDCDRPPCCCPGHLQAVTQSANIKRCFSVGRGRSPFLKLKESCV